jgi:hypothetical protein
MPIDPKKLPRGLDNPQSAAWITGFLEAAMQKGGVDNQVSHLAKLDALIKSMEGVRSAEEIEGLRIGRNVIAGMLREKMKPTPPPDFLVTAERAVDNAVRNAIDDIRRLLGDATPEQIEAGTGISVHAQNYLWATPGAMSLHDFILLRLFAIDEARKRR